MDYEHEQTDKELKRLEKKIQKEYKQAARDVEASMNKWLAQYQKNDDKMRALWKSGEISKKDYTDWRKKQILISDKWKAQREELTARFMEADKVASGLINDSRFEAYAQNFNYGTYEIEKGARLDTAFTLYDKDTVARLVKDNPKLLPPPGKTTSEAIRKGELKRWNQKQIQSVMTQSILQGESIQKISKRLAVTVGEKNAYSHYRAARTMTTSAENAGRMASYIRAQDMGIKVGKTWLAAHDNHTRRSHRLYDGMTIPLNEEFAPNLMFPGDPDADPAEIYNCRCTMIADVLSVDGVDLSDIGAKPWAEEWDIDYDEWKLVREEQGRGPKSAVAPDVFDRNNVQYSGAGKQLVSKFEGRGVQYREVAKWDVQPSEKEIITQLAGGDMTSGSCMSLACAYAGNKNGLNVTDFRGGDSCDIMSYAHSSLVNLAKAKPNTIIEMGDTIKPAKALLKQVEPDKEYIFITGRHAAVVRKNEGVLQYLELQSSHENGWKDFEGDYVAFKGHPVLERTVHRTTSDTLKNRFGCGGRSAGFSSLTDISGFKDDDEFRDILGYINTASDKQKKGAAGSVK